MPSYRSPQPQRPGAQPAQRPRPQAGPQGQAPPDLTAGAQPLPTAQPPMPATADTGVPQPQPSQPHSAPMMATPPMTFPSPAPSELVKAFSEQPGAMGAPAGVNSDLTTSLLRLLGQRG